MLVVTPRGKRECFPPEGLWQTFSVNTESAGAFTQTKQADVGSFICGFSCAGSGFTSNVCHNKYYTNLKDQFNKVSVVLKCALHLMVAFVLEHLILLAKSVALSNVLNVFDLCRQAGSLFLIQNRTSYSSWEEAHPSD